MQRLLLLASTLYFSFTYTHAQIVINEASNRNASQILDEDGDYEDWFELYNAGSDAINLNNYTITDDSLVLNKWIFPNIILNPANYLLVYASGKNRMPDLTTDHWEMPVDENISWSYIIPDATIPADWMENYFDVSSWASGKAGIGYGDADDTTIVADATIAQYLRYEFEITDTSKITDAIFNLDYDDGFVAYLNGNAIAWNGVDPFSAYNNTSYIDHEAVMYAGYAPEQFFMDAATIHTYLIEGINVLAVEVHNVSPGSSDLTARPFLSFGINTADVIWDADLPIWFNTFYSGTNLHTNFKIGTGGEKLFLSNDAGDIIDKLLVDDLETDFSIGRKTDGNDTIQIFAVATPGASNGLSSSYEGYVGTPTFTLGAGFYDGTIKVALNAPAGDVSVYYTLNGEIPTTDDYIYSDSITVSATTVIKARCFDNTNVLLPGKTITNTFFIDETIEVPVISITTNNNNLYGWEGIYDNWWTDWKKPCYIEYFDSVHFNAFEQNSGIKIDGGAGGSRSLAQKSFRIEPDNGVYGDGTLNYPIIPRLWYVNEYETFYLRNGSNMSNVLPYKDAFMTRTADGTLNEHMAYTPIVVFLNGEYWGLYELRDKLDEPHFDHAHNVDPENLDLLSLSYWYGSVMRTLSGSDSDWIEMRDYLTYYPTPEDSDFFDIANQYLDVYQFADYLIGETYLGNADWPWNNIKIWRDRGGDNKWKYGLIDVEWGLGYYAWTNAYSDMINYLLYNNSNIEPFYALKQNERFRNYFINRYADLMNTTFLYDRMEAMEDTIFNEVNGELPRQWEKWWGGALADQIATFNDYRFGLLDDLAIRTENVRTHIESNFYLDGQVELTLDVFPLEAGKIKISTLTIYDMPWSGVYFDGVPVTITAVANTGYTFDHWSVNDFIVDTVNASFTNNITSDQLFTAYFSGEAANEEITISEINYNSEASVNSGDWFEIYNYGDATVNISSWKIQDSDPLHSYVIPENIFIAPESRIVFVSDTLLFQQQHPGINYLGPVGFNLSNNSDYIKIFNDRSELKVQMLYADSSPWPLGANGEGRTLELIDAAIDLNNPDNWFDGCIGGSPGEAYTSCNDAIIISEINYNSIDTANSEDWIEIRNISETAIDIGGWKFMDDSIGTEHEYYVPSPKIILPHTNYILAQNDFAFETQHTDITNYNGPFGFNLNGGGEWLRLYDTTGILRNSIHYDDDLPWNTGADGNGYTLELIDSLGKMNEADNWTIICPQGSPGEYASTPCYDTVVIDTTDNILSEEIMFLSLSPNPASDFTILTIQDLQAENITIELMDINGTLRQNIYEGKLNAEQYIISTKNLPTGIYFISVITDQGRSLMKFVKE
ncbi:MAG: lamin tail domain-containing protein [Fimbriimonadaceae bacterium]|nr:lamin tail domain-containing protein [Chitinophagales bacterium]